VKCDFCKKEGEWKSVICSTEFCKKDGSDIVVCDECLNNYANGDYDKIRLVKE